MLIEPFVDGLIDALGVRARGLAAGQRLHLLIDGAFVPGIHQSIHADRKIMLFASLPGCSQQALDLSSFVMPFDPDDSPVLHMLQRCSGWPMLSVIQTQEDAATLAARMAAWTVIEADGQQFHLRFADTRRSPAIVGVLNPEQRAQFLGPATSWTCITRGGTWRTFGFDGADADVARFPSLDARQFGLLVEDSRIDEMLALFARRHLEPVMPAWQGHEVLSLALQMAARVRLTQAEILDWCEYLWNGGPINVPSHADAKFAEWRADVSSRSGPESVVMP